MSRLNEEQQAAARHGRGHAIVLSGPGTGKTTTLVARHKYLRTKSVDATAIAVLTFTQKAAEELKSRLGKDVPSTSLVGTFHGVCLRLLKRFSQEAGLRKNFKILDTNGQRQLLRSIGIEWDSEDGDLTDIIGRWKDSLISPDEADSKASETGNSVMRKAAQHYRDYEEALKESGDIDFADLVTKAMSTIRSSKKVQAFFETRIQHVLVDEFQDVNKSQIELLQEIARCGSAIWAVADDDQALYGWRGGNVYYTVHFANYFSHAATYKLTLNYRCDPRIIAAANSLIAHNKKRVAKALRATRDAKPSNATRVWRFSTDKEEANWIAERIAGFKKAGARLSDIAILFRTSSISPALQSALELRGIPFTLSGTQNFWELPEVSTLADLITAIEQNDVSSVQHIKGARSLLYSFAGYSPKEMATQAATALASTPPPGFSGERVALWQDACLAAGEIASSFDTASDFVNHISERSGKASSTEDDAVILSTIHSSKGLEWKHVFIAACESSLMPHVKNNDREEERRLFYVALTRSKGSVDATWSKLRFGKAQKQTQFLSEADKDSKGAIQWVNATASSTNETPKKVVEVKTTQQAGFTVYKRRGRKSLIPPGEED